MDNVHHSDIIKFSSVADKNRLYFKMALGIPNFIGTVIPSLLCYLVNILLSEFHKLVIFFKFNWKKRYSCFHYILLAFVTIVTCHSCNIWSIFSPTTSTDFCNEKLIRTYFIVEKHRLWELEIWFGHFQGKFSFKEIRFLVLGNYSLVS